MASLFRTIATERRAPVVEDRATLPMTLDDYATMMGSVLDDWQSFNGGITQTWRGEPAERIGTSMSQLAQYAYKGNGLAFACMAVRMMAFSLVRFSWQRMRNGRPGDLFGTPALMPLEMPWTGGTTQDLLQRMLLDVDLAGNSYVTRDGPWLLRLRPDWVQIILEPVVLKGGIVGYRKLGFTFHNGGIEACPPEKVALFGASEVCHFAPLPDSDASYRGMSWLSACVREITNDRTMERHKTKFFENAAPQPLTARILTPRGWSTMGAMIIGSEVIGSDGKAHTVTGVFPQGEQDMYRVTFADGSTVECTRDHLWTVQNNYDRQRGVTRTMPLLDIVNGGLHYPSSPAKWAVPFVDPIEFDDPGPLFVDPYVLGLLLGDGSFRSNGAGSGGVSLAADARDADATADELAARLPAGVSASRRDRGGWSEFYMRGRGGSAVNPLTASIKALGLWDHLGRDKFVPAHYLRASVTDRLDLLRGLLDSDGSVDTRQPNLVRFTSCSESLARSVDELARSLGGTATVTEVPEKSQWVTRVQRLPQWIVPFRLPRKVAVYTPSAERGIRHRFIVDVKRIGREEAQCIRVDTPDSLYVTDGYVLTHNTPNLSVSLDKAVSADDFAKFKERMDTEHVGTDNAYKTLYLGGGADVKVIGANFDQIKLNDVQGRGETRVAAAAGVPAIIVGLSEGLSSGTYSNYGQAMRRFADLTMASLWGNVSGSLATLLRSPGSDARLWYDTRDVAFLREDRTAAAGIQQIGAATINQYIVSGFEPDSAVAAWTAQDPTLLVHTGLVSVQLQPPGLVAADGKTPIASTDTPAPAASTNAAAQLMLPLGPLDTVDRALGADTGDHPALSTTNGKHL